MGKGTPKKGEDKSFLEGIGEFGKALVETPAKLVEVGVKLNKRKQRIDKTTASYRK